MPRVSLGFSTKEIRSGATPLPAGVAAGLAGPARRGGHPPAPHGPAGPGSAPGPPPRRQPALAPPARTGGRGPAGRAHPPLRPAAAGAFGPAAPERGPV